jgi:hypothetical protein
VDVAEVVHGCRAESALRRHPVLVRPARRRTAQRDDPLLVSLQLRQDSLELLAEGLLLLLRVVRHLLELGHLGLEIAEVLFLALAKRPLRRSVLGLALLRYVRTPSTARY